MVEQPRPLEANRDPEKLRIALKAALTRSPTEKNAYVMKTEEERLKMERNAQARLSSPERAAATLKAPGGLAIIGGKLNAAANEWKELKSDGTVPAGMSDHAIDICNKSFQYMQNLREDIKVQFVPTTAPNDVKEFRGNAKEELDGILEEAQDTGVIMFHEPSGKIANNVGKAIDALRRIEKLEEKILTSYGRERGNGPTIDPKFIAALPYEIRVQLQLTARAKDFFQMVIDGEPFYKNYHDRVTNTEKMDPAYERYWKSARMLALLASVGMFTVSAIIDLKNKNLSVYTLAWLGISAGAAGFFKGEEATTLNQLQFVKQDEWQTFEMNTRNDADLLKAIRKAHEKDEVQAKYKELKAELAKNLGSKKSPALQARLTLLQDQYIELFSGQSDPNLTALLKKKIKNPDKDRETQRLEFLVDRTMNLNDIGFDLLANFTANGIGPKSVEKDLLTNKEPTRASATPPSSSALGETPPAHRLPRRQS